MTKFTTRREANPALAAALDRQAALRHELRTLQAEAREIAATNLNDEREARAAALIGAVS